MANQYEDYWEEEGIREIEICAHCNKVKSLTSEWGGNCELSKIKTKPENVILHGSGVAFYDPNPLVVQAERERRQARKDAAAEKRRLSREVNNS